MGKKARLKCVEGVSTVSVDYSFRKLKWKMRDKAMKWEGANGPEEPERQKSVSRCPGLHRSIYQKGGWQRSSY